jgi:hypothetical protein
MDHVTFWVPMLILAISKNLNELLQDSIMTSMTSLREPSGVMIVAIYVSIMFVVAILGAEYGWTCGASKMLNMVFPIQGGDVGSTQCISARVAQKI